MKTLVLFIAIVSSANLSFGRPAPVDSLHIDSLIIRFDELNQHYLDSSILVAENAIELSRQINYQSGEAAGFDKLGFAMDRKGKYEEGIGYYSQSLKIKIRTGDPTAAWTMGEIGYCYNKLGKLDSSLKYLQMGVDFAKKHKADQDMALGIFRIGWYYHTKGDLQKAMSHYEEALLIGERLNNQFIIIQCLSKTSTIYYQLKDYSRALDFGEQSMEVALDMNDERIISDTHSRIGMIYMAQKDYDEAKIRFEEALKIAAEIEHLPGMVNAHIALGNLNMEQKQFDKALENYQNANRYSIKMKAVLDQSRSLYKLGNAYFEMKDFGKAVSLGKESIELAKSIEEPFIQKNAAELLWKAFRKMNDFQNALIYHELFKVLADSASSADFEKSLIEKEMIFKQTTDSLRYAREQQYLKAEQEKKDIRQRNIRNFITAGLAGALIFLIVVYRQRNKISKARKRSDELLLNILPEEVAEELKEKGSADARDFEMVSILFTDFKDFTQKGAKLSAAELVNEINYCFEGFDTIMEKYGIEKIKTIGDAYMAAGGLPVPTNDSVKNTILAALEMQSYITDRKANRDGTGLPVFEMRVGIHTGPVVAGIVGVKKFQYDLWGDTVNTASRIESNGDVGKVNISQTTYDLLKDDPDFIFESRGKVEAKGKGDLEMYFVSSSA